MRKKSFFLVLALLSFCCLTKASDNLTIQVHLFHTTCIKGQPSLQKTEVLTISSHPELSSIKEKLIGSEFELKAAMIDTLMNVFDLSAVDDLFLHKKQWNGLGKPLMKDVVMGKLSSYKIRILPIRLPSQQISLHLVISGGKINPANLGGDTEIVVDQELVLDIGNPVIVGVPHKDEAYFVMVVVTIGSLTDKKPKPKKKDKVDKIDLVPAPKAIYQVQPAYPEELIKRRIGGNIGLRITIDKKGIVQKVEIVKPLYPYHNYSAVQAFRQWTFEPVLREGKPVPVMFLYTYNFNPLFYLQKITWNGTSLGRSDSSFQEELRKVLAGSRGYCQRLKNAVFDFICEETIKETHYNLIKNIKWMMLAIVPRGYSTERSNEMFKQKPEVRALFKIMDPQRTLRNKFLCDYQIIKKANTIRERRIVLKENGRKVAEKKNLLEEKRFSGVSSLFAPIRILAKDQQSKFDFRIIDEKKVHGQKVYVIEAIPKFGNENGIWSAKIWIDKKNYQVLKCEIEGIPIYGYEDVLNDCAILNIKPIFVTTHEYRIKKNMVLFPARSEIRVAYPRIDSRGAITKIKMKLTYDKYKFFTVETKSKIIK